MNINIAALHANPYCFIKTMGLFLLFTSIKTMEIATSKCILYQTIHRACLYFTNKNKCSIFSSFW